MREMIIKKTDQGKTLQAMLRGAFPYALVEKIFRKNGVRVNGERGKPERKLKHGDRLVFFIPLQAEAPPEKHVSNRWSAPKLGYDVLLEDDDLIVVNKHPGIAVHEGKTVLMRDSLLGQLREAYKEKNIRPHLVHRLDSQTSGALVVVKDEALVEPFEALFEEGKIEKEYLVLVFGKTNAKGTISNSLPGREGQPVSALTHYDLQQYFPKARVSLLRVIIKTGRKHQIRLHFSKLGHPVVMDQVYGDFDLNKAFKKLAPLKRQFLHAARLSFLWKEKPITVFAPLTKDLQETLQQLKIDRSASRNSRL